MSKHLLRVDEAAMLLSVSRWTIYRWVQEGRLDATKIGKGSLRIFQTSVAALIEHNRTAGDERSIVMTAGRPGSPAAVITPVSDSHTDVTHFVAAVSRHR